MARWKLCASTTFEILPLSTCTLCQQKSYISKGIEPIFEIFASARRCWGWTFGWKVSGAQVFYFCNGKVKTLRIDNIWNFATFNMYTVPAKILYLQRYSTDFRNLCISSKMLRVGIWVESFRCAGILLLQWQGENFAHRQHLKFCHFSTMYTVPAKILYLQRYSTDFRNLCLSSKMLRVGIWVEKFRCAGILLLQWQGENFAHRQHLKFCHFQPVHCASKNPISPKVFNRFSKSLLSSKMLNVGIWVECFRCAGILLLQWQGENFAHRQHLKFCHFQHVHCASKNPISPKVFNRFSKSFPQLEDVEGGHLGGKVFQVRRYFTFAMARWKLLRIDNIWNFATFNMYTVPAKILYLQRYSTDFRNLCISSKMLRVGIWVESFRCAGVLLLQWQGENFAHRQHLKFCHFQHVHCASKNPISPKVFNRFSKSLHQLEDVHCGHLDGMFQVRRYFTFALARGELCATTTFEILQLSTCTLCRQKFLYFQRYLTDFRKLRLSSKIVEGGHSGGKFQVRRFFSFAIARWKLCASKTFEILPLSTCVLWQQKSCMSQRYWTDFRESLFQLEDVEGGDLGGKFKVRSYFTFAIASWKLCAVDNIWNFSTFNLCTLSGKIQYLQRYSTDFRNLCISSKMLKVGIRVEGFRCAGFFTFAMARWKLCASKTFEILPLSTCILCQQKSYFSKGIQPIFKIFASARRCSMWAFGWYCFRCAGILILQ